MESLISLIQLLGPVLCQSFRKVTADGIVHLSFPVAWLPHYARIMATQNTFDSSAALFQRLSYRLPAPVNIPDLKTDGSGSSPDPSACCIIVNAAFLL